MSNENTLPAQQTFSLAPRTLSEAMDFAKMMADSELVPKSFRGKPGDVLIAVQMGSEVGLQPMASIQNIAVINGKPGIYGDAGKAILLAAGCVIEEDDIEIIKRTGRARCKITRGNRPPVERTYCIENAKTAGLWNKEGPWRTNPERQMAWRAFWFAARDVASDLLKGLGGAEELTDHTPRDMGTIDRETGEVTKSGAPEKEPLPACPDAKIDRWIAKVESGKAQADELLAFAEGRHTLSPEQTQRIEAFVASKLNPPIDADFTKAYEGAEQ
jgi:hypothetical protein